MQVSKQISNEPITNFKRIVHYAGLEDYPAIFQPQNTPAIVARFVCEYFTSGDHLIKRTIFVFRIDNKTKVNPATGSIDSEGIGEADFFDLLLLNPIVLTDVVEGYISELDIRGEFDEANFYRRETKPIPFA